QEAVRGEVADLLDLVEEAYPREVRTTTLDGPYEERGFAPAGSTPTARRRESRHVMAERRGVPIELWIRARRNRPSARVRGATLERDLRQRDVRSFGLGSWIPGVVPNERRQVRRERRVEDLVRHVLRSHRAGELDVRVVLH